MKKFGQLVLGVVASTVIVSVAARLGLAALLFMETGLASKLLFLVAYFVVGYFSGQLTARHWWRIVRTKSRKYRKNYVASLSLTDRGRLSEAVASEGTYRYMRNAVVRFTYLTIFIWPVVLPLLLLSTAHRSMVNARFIEKADPEYATLRQARMTMEIEKLEHEVLDP